MTKQHFISTRINFNLLITFVLTLTIMNSCKKSAYTELVRAELATEVINDSLKFGLKLGVPRQHFYDICWQLNKEQKVKQGPLNNFVEYKLPTKNKDRVEERITMLFYGIFDEEKIMTGLDMKFYFDAWSPWNKSLHADKLIPVVKDTLLSWYPGNNFIPITLKKSDKEVLIKVDGNRRILIESPKDSRQLDVRIDDLRYVEGIN